jgi:hypothetical protein
MVFQLRWGMDECLQSAASLVMASHQQQRANWH